MVTQAVEREAIQGAYKAVVGEGKLLSWHDGAANGPAVRVGQGGHPLHELPVDVGCIY